MPKFLVLNQQSEPHHHITEGEATRMVALGQAEYTRKGNAVRLVGPTEAQEHPCRTRTARGNPMLAACGRSQEYTTRNEQGRVDGFKTIFPEDRPAYIAAVLDNIVSVYATIDGQHRLVAVKSLKPRPKG